MKKNYLGLLVFVLSYALSVNGQTSNNFYYDAKAINACLACDSAKAPIAFFKAVNNYTTTYPYINIRAIKREFAQNPLVDINTFSAKVDSAMAYLVRQNLYAAMGKVPSPKQKDSLYELIKGNVNRRTNKDSIIFIINGLNVAGLRNSIKADSVNVASAVNGIVSATPTVVDVSALKTNLTDMNTAINDQYSEIKTAGRYINIVSVMAGFDTNDINAGLDNLEVAAIELDNLQKLKEQVINLVDTITVVKTVQLNVDAIKANIITITGHIRGLTGLLKTVADNLNSKIQTSSSGGISLKRKNAQPVSILTQSAFIKQINEKHDVVQPSINSSEAKSSIADVAKSTAKASTGSIQSDALYAAADFIAERFKDELDAYFLQLFDSTLGKSILLKDILPQTMQLLKADDAYSFVNKPSLIQNSLQNDLNNVLPDLDSYLMHEEKLEVNKNIETGDESDVICVQFLLKQLRGSLLSQAKNLSQFRTPLNKTDAFLVNLEFNMLDGFNKHYADLNYVNLKSKIVALNILVSSVTASLEVSSHRFYKKIFYSTKHYVRRLNIYADDIVVKRAFITLYDKSILQHIHLVFQLIEKIKSEKDAADAVAILGDDSFVSQVSINPNFQSSCKLIYALSQGLRAKGKSNTGWISIDSINKLADADKILFMGLIYEKVKGIKYHTRFGDKDLGEVVDANHITQLFSYVRDLVTDVNTIAQYTERMKSMAKKDSLNVNDFLTYYKQISGVVRLLYSPPVASHSDTLVTKVIDKLDTISNEIIMLYSDITQKSWNSIVGDLVHTLQTAMGTNFPESKLLLKYGSFAAAIATAKNSNDIEKAIENVALPPGSYSIKRKSVRNICINSFAGGTVNYNLFYQQGGMFTTAPMHNYNVGFTAPIGLALSWGERSHKDTGYINYKRSDGQTGYLTGRSLTLFLSILDLGQIVQVRLSNSQNTVPPQISVQQFVSPGLFFLYGFGKCPISLLAGINYRPQLATGYESGSTSTTNQTGTSDYSNQIRFNIGIVADIPLINIYTKVDK